MKIAICIDYDNLSKLQKLAGITSIILNSLIKLPETTKSNSGTCEVRLYGGWFEGENLSNLSQDISASIQDEFPLLLKIPNEKGICKFNVTVELAYSLLEEPGHHLFNTYRRKGKPNNLRIEKQINIGCAALTCPIPMARKLLEKGVCPSVDCTNKSTNIVYRHEQKLVDTMLTCDLIYLANHLYDYLIIISADDDFLPPIRTLLLRGLKVIRVHPRMSTDHKPIMVGGKKLIEVGL